MSEVSRLRLRGNGALASIVTRAIAATLLIGLLATVAGFVVAQPPAGTPQTPATDGASAGGGHGSAGQIAAEPALLAQWDPRWRGERRRGFDRRVPLDGSLPTRAGVPEWENDPEFEKDVFTFVRVMYRSEYWGRRGGGGWATDFPASDLNFSFRLQQLTSLKVNPESKYFPLTDPQLFDYPFIYLIEPGALVFNEAEVKALRRYLLNGGFLMVDDFWGEDEWYNFRVQFERVFPDRPLVELPLEHPIFHCVYDLKEKPQIPSINHARGGRSEGRTWERYDAQTPHYKAVFDDNERMMAIICHNTDLGDGWEREGEDPWYFREFSEKYAYPLGINIVVYAMTH